MSLLFGIVVFIPLIAIFGRLNDSSETDFAILFVIGTWGVDIETSVGFAICKLGVSAIQTFGSSVFWGFFISLDIFTDAVEIITLGAVNVETAYVSNSGICVFYGTV